MLRLLIEAEKRKHKIRNTVQINGATQSGKSKQEEITMLKTLTNAIMFTFLTIGLAVSVSAKCLESKMDLTFTEGAETAEGSFEPHNGVIYGNSYVMNSYNNSFSSVESRHLTISLNYLITIHHGSPLVPPPGYPIEGGAWSMAIVRDGSYIGTVYGDISYGDVAVGDSDGENSTEKLITAAFSVKGGLGSFGQCNGGGGRMEANSTKQGASANLSLIF